MNNDTKPPEPSTSVKPGVMYLEHPRGVLSIIDYEVCHGECHVCGTKWFTREVVRECPTCDPVAGENRPKSIPFAEILAKQLENPEVRAEYEKLSAGEKREGIQLPALDEEYQRDKPWAIAGSYDETTQQLRCRERQLMDALRRAAEAEGRAEAAETKLAEARATIAALEAKWNRPWADALKMARNAIKLDEGSETK